MAKANYTVVGRLGADPERRYSTAGRLYARFRVAENDSWRDQESGAWVRGEPNWWDVICWDPELADHVATSLRSGMQVVVSGVFEQREYTAADGARRSSTTLKARYVGLELRRGPVQQAVRDRRAVPGDPAERVDTSTGEVSGRWDGLAPAGAPAAESFEVAAARGVDRFDARPLTDYRGTSDLGSGDDVVDDAVDDDELERSA